MSELQNLRGSEVRRFAGVRGVRGVRGFAGFGTQAALAHAMARQYDELDAWQLANELKRAVYKLTETGSVTRDFDFYHQIRGSAASAPSNIAEGFGRYKPAQFRHFLDIAIASLTETANHLRDGVDRKHFSSSDITTLLPLAARARGAAIALKAYLKDAKPPEPGRTRRRNSDPLPS